MTVNGVTGWQPGGESDSAAPKNIEEVAAQFEALLISEMLRHARETGGAGLGEGGESLSAMMGFAEQQLGQLIAARGGLGLGRLVAGSFEPSTSKTAVKPPD
jgi:Rod binding domain-containing protein